MIDEKEILRRRDMREVFTFTIDPADAKDFDDALSFEPVSDSGQPCSGAVFYQVGVHIADVSYYVRPGTTVDDEAYKRGTSVYLVDRVLPMLPEELCNDKCSLRPGEDKLCMSVIFTFEVPVDADGTPLYNNARVVKYKVCRTVIRSDVRLDYDEAQTILETANSLHDSCQTRKRHVNETETTRKRIGGMSGGNRGETGGITEALVTLNALAAKLRAERIAAGALTIEQDEMRFRLDEHHHPVEIYFEHPNEAHHLIEEFMLLANRTIAKAVGSGRPFVYRVHDLPDGDKLEAVQAFRRKMGNRVTAQTIDLLTIRAQAKAVYSTYNIGHYGLAFSHYTHFTSPIRRYPDLMVHRLVEKYILTGKKISLTREELEDKCEHCSACEQEAAQAERDSVKLFQTIWMSDHLGEVMDGHISGVTDFGLFVQLDGNRCEGLIRISAIGEEGEYWQHDEKNYRLVCENGKGKQKSFTLGDPLKVRVIRCDINKSQIDFELV